MTELTPDDVRHWDLSLIYQMFDAATRIHNADKTLGESVANIRARTQWHGEGGDAFRAELGKDIKHIDADGHLSQGVAIAIRDAERDVQYCQAAMNSLHERAKQYGWTFTPTWEVDISNANDEGRKHDPQSMRDALTALKEGAVATDHELALALRAAVGDAQVDNTGNEVPPAAPARDVGSQERPGVTDVNDTDIPGQGWRPGFDPEKWKQSWQNPMLADNPPGYTGGKEGRDQAWKDYLAHFPTDKRGYLPNPDAVDDPGLKVVGAAGTQLGTSYAWAGGDMKGASKGDHAYDKNGRIIPGDAAEKYQDYNRVGFDCSGLAEYAANQAQPGTDIGGWTGPQVGSPPLTNVKAGDPLQPGDFVFYGPGSADHVGIYVAPGVILNAPQSGLPVQLDHRTTVSTENQLVRVRRLPS